MSSPLDDLLQTAADHNRKLVISIDQADNYSGPFAAAIKGNPLFTQAKELANDSHSIIAGLALVVMKQREQLNQGGIDGEQRS